MARRFAFLNDWTSIFLGTIERVGNARPHPATIFAILALLIVLISAWPPAPGSRWSTRAPGRALSS